MKKANSNQQPQKHQQQSKQNKSIQQQFQNLENNLQYFLDHYNLKGIQEMVQIILNKPLSQQFKLKFPQFNSEQNQQSKLSTKLQKLAVQHSYHEMYIYYQQFPMYIEQCKKVLRFKYQSDDILRTHQNRKSIWLLCSGALFKIRQNVGYYDKIESYQKSYPQFFKHTIEKDVVRTIQDKNNIQSQQILSQILRKFAVKNPYIGYCQGMNFIVNFLIMMQFTKEQIFWLVSQLLEQFLPKTYYTNMMGVAVDIYIIEQYVKQHHSALYDKLQQMNLNISLFTLEWLVCLFTTTLPFYMLVIIWDMMFLHGSSVLIKVCLVILEQLEQTIINTQDISELLVLIQSKKKGIFIEQDQFISRITKIYIDNTLLNLCRDIVELKLMKEKIEVNQTIKKNKKEQHIDCSIEWPVCFKALKQHKSDLGQIETWTFKQDGPPKIINDYLNLKNKSSFKPLQDSRGHEKKMMIGRIPHVCDVNEYNKKQLIQKESIELEEYDLLNRRVLVNDISTWTSKIEADNKHVDFFKRATSNNLAFLNFNAPKLKNRNSLKNSSSKHPQTNKNYASVIVQAQQELEQKQQSKNSHQISNKNEKISNKKTDKKLQNDMPQFIKTEISHRNSDIDSPRKSRNPFKRVKQKYRQKK